ncbi:MAG: RIP metalloprotease RseP [Bacteroidetes bacterium]|nr:RIP metalloprotease RseP [Bacteroidota bacterium]MBL0050775.1 RIP metalloprotease RseP [Bacteroidota bacterium]
MDVLIMAAQLICGLSILVTVHELGHFWAARAFGIKVEKFYLFFDAWNVKLFSFKKGDTEYGIGWLPLGGYVKIAGMIDESMDKEAMALPPQPWEFRSKPAWQRLIVMLGGVTMNVILGIIIFTCLLFFAKKDYYSIQTVNKHQGIVANKYGKELGFETGDKILSIDGKSFERFEDLISTRVLFGATVEIERNGVLKNIVVPGNFYKTLGKSDKWDFIAPDTTKCVIAEVLPAKNAAKAGLKKDDEIVAINDMPIYTSQQVVETMPNYKSQNVKFTIKRDNQILQKIIATDTAGKIGIAPYTDIIADGGIEKTKYSFFTAFTYGMSDAFQAITSNIKGLGKLIKGEEKAKDSLQGPVGIAVIYGAHWDWLKFWTITGLLSMVLALMNILPIPALDGGHVVFLLFEAITNRKLSDKFMERAQMVGMVILLSLMAYSLFNDILRQFTKS